MTRVRVAATFAFLLFAAPGILAQSQNEAQPVNSKDHVITVARAGEAYAKPDLGILVMSIRSSSPIADEAVAENGRKAKAVETALAALGFAPSGYKITPLVFGQAGGPRYGPMQPEMTAYEASQFVYVLFEAADLGDTAKLTEKTAAVIEALRKAGAVPGNVMGPRMPQAQEGLIIFTVKDSDPYERQALQKAIARARDAAKDIATGMGVEITGLRNVRGSALGGNYLPHSGLPSLEGLPYRFYSTTSDEIKISTTVTVEYDFK
jgi:uncharacterized protein YggE